MILVDLGHIDGAETTARHWVGVYARLTRVAEIAEDAQLDAEAAARMATTRARLASRLRYWRGRLRESSPEEIRS